MKIIKTRSDVDLSDSRNVLIEESAQYEEQLLFVNSDKRTFVKTHTQFLSDACLLNDTFLLRAFQEKLNEEGYHLFALESALPVISLIESFYEPLTVDGLNLATVNGKASGLFPYQQFAVRKSLHFFSRSVNSTFFLNHATGTGKSVTSMALIQELLVNRKEFDYALVFTLKKNKINFCRDINSFTSANACQNEGTKAKRDERYKDFQYNVFVMNYEKCHFDLTTLRSVLKGKRVLIIADEIQKILSYPGENRKNRSRKGLDNLIRVFSSYFVVPTSATVVDGNPPRFRRVYDIGYRNPLESSTEFLKEYGKTVSIWNYNHWEQKTEWNVDRLKRIRHIVAPQTHCVRKTDPGVKEFFKSTRFIPEIVQMSEEDRFIYDEIKFLIRQNIPKGASSKEIMPYFQALTYLCNTAESFNYSENVICKAFVELGKPLTSYTSSKMEMLLDKVEEIVDQGDKVVVFTHWTNLSLFPISKQMRGRKIPHVQHHGGLSDKAAQAAQDDFKRLKSIPVFLTSDAGSHALSFPEARYVINYEIPHSYDLLTQRCDRIDRATSHFDGITSYAYITEDTVEEGIWETNNARRELSAAMQGTVEELGRSAVNIQEKSLRELIFP